MASFFYTFWHSFFRFNFELIWIAFGAKMDYQIQPLAPHIRRKSNQKP
jgi:hypothetical protein